MAFIKDFSRFFLPDNWPRNPRLLPPPPEGGKDEGGSGAGRSLHPSVQNGQFRMRMTHASGRLIRHKPYPHPQILFSKATRGFDNLGCSAPSSGGWVTSPSTRNAIRKLSFNIEFRHQIKIWNMNFVEGTASNISMHHLDQSNQFKKWFLLD